MVQATEHCYIVKDNEILGGEPIIKGTRTPVRAIVEPIERTFLVHAIAWAG